MTFSYLPPGTPAWPATVPPMPLAVAAAQTATEMEGERRLAATKPLSARPKRSARSVLVITALFILVPLVAIGATLGTLWYNGEIPVKTVNASLILPTQPPQTPTTSSALTPTTPAQTNQLPTPSSYQTTTIPEVGIALKYPIEWVKDAPQTTTNSVVFAFHPQQKNGILIYIERFTAATSAKITSTNDVNQGNLTAFQSLQGVTNFHAITPAAAQISIGGVNWDEQDATFSTTQGLLYHLVSIAVQHNQLYYDILYYAPTVVYNEAVQKYFQPMLDSVQFQS
ncbi:MAG TPA: hypothetical protein VEL69_00640 [Ktedonobacteraceae bacterium]|nr:hypothetical protein [Ktedonobacteraceae bacterium]